MKEKILEKVGAFPPLDDTVNNIMTVCNDPNGSVMELAKIVEKDPMTTANILKAANSPLYGFSREVKNIGHAVSIFGMETVKGFAFSSFLQKKPNLDLSPYNIDAESFTSVSQAQNAFIAKWYKGKKQMLDTLGLTSFLMEMGKIVLADIVIEHKKSDEFKNFLADCKSNTDIKELELKVFGLTNEDITTMILKEWNFNSNICNAIKYINNPELADKDVQKISASLKAVRAIISTSNFDKDASLKEAVAIVKKYNLDSAKFLELAEETLGLTKV